MTTGRAALRFWGVVLAVPLRLLGWLLVGLSVLFALGAQALGALADVVEEV